MSFGVNLGKTPTAIKFRSPSSILGATSVADLACRVDTAMQSLMSQLNSSVAPGLGSTQCCDVDPLLHQAIGDYKVGYSDATIERIGQLDADISQLAVSPSGLKMVAINNSLSKHVLMYWKTIGLTGLVDKPFIYGANHDAFGTGHVTNAVDDDTRYNGSNWVTFDPTERYVISHTNAFLFNVYDTEAQVHLATYNWGFNSGSFRPVWDKVRNLLYLGRTDRLIILKLDPNTQVLSLVYNELLGTGGFYTPRDISVIPRTDGTKIIVGTTNNKMLILDTSNPTAPVILDEVTPSNDFPDNKPGPVSGVKTDCSEDVTDSEGGLIVFNGTQTNGNDDGNAIYVYAFDKDYQLTSRGSVTMDPDGSETYDHESAAYANGRYAFLISHFSAGTKILTADISDPDLPIIHSSLILAEAGSSGKKYYWADDFHLMQAARLNSSNNFRSTMTMYESLSEATKGDLDTLELDILYLRSNCFPAIRMEGDEVVPNLNAERLDGKFASAFQLRSDMTVDVWAWEF